MAVLKTNGHDKNIGGAEIAANSLVATRDRFIAIKSGFANLALVADRIVGISVQNKTYDSDNQTVKKEKLNFIGLDDTMEVKSTVVGGTIAQANVGSLYDIDANGDVNTVVAASVAQVDTLTLTGTSGTASVTATGGLAKTATFNTNLTTTASDFVTAEAAAYASQGVTLTSSGVDLIFTSDTAGTAFLSPVIANVTGDLDGTVANTTANVIGEATQLRLTKVISTTEGLFVIAK